MKILHTSDWHVGKVLKGRDRHDEHLAVLRSLVQAARDEDVDVVLIAGDLFETAAPTAKAQGLVMRTLLALREDARQVVVIAGNHDNASLLDAVYRPVLGELGLHVLGTPKRPDAGGLLALRTRGGETVNVAALPFLSHRYAVRAAEILLHEFAEHALDYAQRVAEIVRLLTQGFTADAVNLCMAHATLLGGRRLRTLGGTLDQVISEGEQAGDAYLRVVLAEPSRAGLGDLVRDKLPNTLEVMLDDAHRPRPGTRDGDRPTRIGRSPAELFGDYLSEENIDDPRITAMFAELLDEVTGAAGTADAASVSAREA